MLYSMPWFLVSIQIWILCETDFSDWHWHWHWQRFMENRICYKMSSLMTIGLFHPYPQFRIMEFHGARVNHNIFKNVVIIQWFSSELQHPHNCLLRLLLAGLGTKLISSRFTIPGSENLSWLITEPNDFCLLIKSRIDLNLLGFPVSDPG